MTSNETSHLQYGSANLTGRYVKDHVCLTDDSELCVDNMTFFMITQSEGLDEDGILGFSPVNQTIADQHIVHQLYNQSQIPEQVATF